MTENLVANPRYAELERALSIVRAKGQILQETLDTALTLFTGEQVWVGPTARTFADDLAQQRKLLKGIIDGVIDQLEAELGRTRPEVPESMARNRPV